MYQHVIWDFDGTLFNTYPVMATLFQELLEKEGITEPAEEIQKQLQVSMGFALQHYEQKYQIDPDFVAEYQRQRKEREAALAQPFEGIEEICKYIYFTGRKNYLYTHRGESAVRLLKRYGLYSYFQDIVTSRQGFPRKPSPEAIRYLIEKHHIQPEEAVMIGDRELDLLAAKNAGISAGYFNENKEQSGYADFIIGDFKKLYTFI